MIELITLKTKNLTKNNINQICTLKNSFWKYSQKSQIEFLKKNSKKNDLHNLIYLNKKLVGYTMLRKRTYLKSNKIFRYFLYDSMIITKKLRNTQITKLMMCFNIQTIETNKIPSILICKKQLINFYRKYLWKNASLNRFKFIDFERKHCLMYFDKLNLFKTNKIDIYFNK